MLPVQVKLEYCRCPSVIVSLWFDSAGNRAMKTYRMAIVGLGRMGSTIDAEVEGYPSITLPYSIAASAKAISRLELVAGCDLVPAKTEAFSKKWGVERTYTDYQKMLASEKPDMVAICTPGPLHAQMTIAAAEAGATMIYCEKAM